MCLIILLIILSIISKRASSAQNIDIRLSNADLTATTHRTLIKRVFLNLRRDVKEDFRHHR